MYCKNRLQLLKTQIIIYGVKSIFNQTTIANNLLATEAGFSVSSQPLFTVLTIIYGCIRITNPITT